jgi:hypothetical protein
MEGDSVIHRLRLHDGRTERVVSKPSRLPQGCLVRRDPEGRFLILCDETVAEVFGFD